VQLSEYIQKLTEDLNAKQDQWVLETLRKNGIQIKDNYTTGDLYFMQQFHNVKFEKHEDRIDLRIDGKLKGQWYTKYETDYKENQFTLKTNCWN
jgi:hypothetical protein